MPFIHGGRKRGRGRVRRYNAPVRCGRDGCRARQVLRLPMHTPEEDLPRCPCGGRLHFCPDVYERHRRERCWCSGIPFSPHRAGTFLDPHTFCSQVTHLDERIAAWERGERYCRPPGSGKPKPGSPPPERDPLIPF